MKVTVKGFSLNFTKEVSTADFLQEIERFEGQEITILGKKLFLYTNIVNNFIVGIILRYKDNKKSIITEEVGKELEFKIDKLKAGQHGTEVSLFAINPDTLHGVFYSYSGCTGANDYKKLFHKAFSSSLKQKHKDKRNELTNFGKKNIKNLNSKVSKLLPTTFEFSLLTSKSDLSSILSKLNQIDKVTLKATNALIDSGKYTPLTHISRNCRIEVDIDKNSHIDTVKKHIRNVFSAFSKQKEETALRIRGKTHMGSEIDQVIGDNLNDFGYLDFDDYVNTLPSQKWKEYTSCLGLSAILKILIDKVSIFGPCPLDDQWRHSSTKENILLEIVEDEETPLSFLK